MPIKSTAPSHASNFTSHTRQSDEKLKLEKRNKMKLFTYTATCLVCNRQESHNNGPFSKQYILINILYLRSDSPM